MKTNIPLIKISAAFALSLGFPSAIPSAFAQTTAPAPGDACNGARTIVVKEAKWVTGLGRGMVIVDAGKTVVCDACSFRVAAATLPDRNSIGAKASGTLKNVRDCSKSGCCTARPAIEG